MFSKVLLASNVVTVLGKGGGSSDDNNEVCEGSWQSTACENGMLTKTYKITANAHLCSYKSGTTKEENCGTSCQGSFGAWSMCEGGEQIAQYTVMTPARNGGKPCSHRDGQEKTEACKMPEVKEYKKTSSVTAADLGLAVNMEETQDTYMTRMEMKLAAEPTDMENLKAPLCRAMVRGLEVGGCTVSNLQMKKADGEGRHLADHTILLADFDLAVKDFNTMTKKVDDSLNALTTEVTNELQAVNVEVKTVAQAMVNGKPMRGGMEAKPTETINWNMADGSVYQDVSCALGGSVTFTWNPQWGHTVVKMADTAAYVDCNFDGSQTLSDTAPGTYTFPCADLGTHYMACSPHCKVDNHRVRIQVVDDSKTLLLRNTWNEEEGHYHYSYGQVQREYLQPNHQGFTNNQVAKDAYDKLWCAKPHSPESCADWLVGDKLTKANCDALLLVAMGFVSRKRPEPMYEEALTYYDDALAVKPKFCSALSYKTELFLQQKEMSKATSAYKDLCTQCGTSNLDFVSVTRAYSAAGEKEPCGTDCNPNVCPPQSTGSATSLSVSLLAMAVGALAVLV